MKISIVVPCFNEEEVLPTTIERLSSNVQSLADKGKVSTDSEILFVDDGSHDATWAIIEESAARRGMIRGIKLSRNQGHQTALLAGILAARGDVVVSMDADLQDDIGALEQMVDAAAEGYDVVYGVRKKRESDSFLKRMTAESYYHVLRWMGVEVVFNHADFRLLTRRAVEALKGFREVNLFLRGIIPLVGFPAKEVFYERRERFAGQSKYPVAKMVALALDGVTSFSAFPLRLIMLLGLVLSAFSTALGVWALLTRFYGSYVPGWASTVVPAYFLGGIQLFSIGVLGEYLAKIYVEVKARPRYHVEKTT